MTAPSNRAADPADARVMSGEAWESFCGALQRASRLVLGEDVPDSPRDRAEGFRHLTRFLAAGITICIEHADPDYPEFFRPTDSSMKWGLDCPDALYLYATIRGDATYRIFGNRGTVHHLNFQVMYGHFAYGSLESAGAVASINGEDIAVGPDGAFELILSPEEHGGNWVRLAPNAAFLFVRQYFNDWENELPADLAIERVGSTFPLPPPRTDQIASKLDRLSMWMERGGALWEQLSRATMSMEPNTLNVFLLEDSEKHAMRGQVYGLGNFRCARNEAVIVEFIPPKCCQWSVSLANWYWESLDFASRQTSLNGHQSRLDADGVFRGVIAHEDPGVPNWLDTAGHDRGTVALRSLLADSSPEVQMKCVSLDRLRSELPADTPRIDPPTRAAILERRRQAVRRRYRW